jgi:NADPH2:quinone reductase
MRLHSPSTETRAVAPDGVDRIADVDLADDIDLDADVVAIGGVISSCYSSNDRPRIPYWKLGFADTTHRLLGGDDFPLRVRVDAAQQFTPALLDGRLRSVIAERLSITGIARAHELVKRGVDGRVIVIVDTAASPCGADWSVDPLGRHHRRF